GEIEAARGPGMSRRLLYRRIVLPKASRIALPASSKELVFLFQASSLVPFITLLALTGVPRALVARPLAVQELYSAAGPIYRACTCRTLWVFRRIERRLFAHLRRPEAEQAKKLTEAALT